MGAPGGQRILVAEDEAALRDFVSRNLRSEERRVGNTCRYRWAPYH